MACILWLRLTSPVVRRANSSASSSSMSSHPVLLRRGICDGACESKRGCLPFICKTITTMAVPAPPNLHFPIVRSSRVMPGPRAQDVAAFSWSSHPTPEWFIRLVPPANSANASRLEPSLTRQGHGTESSLPSSTCGCY